MRKMISLQERRFDEGRISVSQKDSYRIGYEDGGCRGYKDGRLFGLGVGTIVGFALGAFSLAGIVSLVEKHDGFNENGQNYFEQNMVTAESTHFEGEK